MNNPTLCFVAGKSGGHIIPCLTLAQQAKAKNPSMQILFFSTTALLDAQIIQNNMSVDTHVGLPLETISARKWYLLPKLWILLMRSFGISFYQLYKKRPSKIISTGGHIAIPVCAAARLLRIPIELYELNVQPGKAIKWLASHADVMHVCFKKTSQLLARVPCTVTDYPIRFSVQDKEDIGKIEDLGLDPTKKTVFVLGGSQGSRFINEAIKEALTVDPLLASQINIIHQTGPADQLNWQHFYENSGISAHVFAFSDTIAPYYQAADVIISRAGAGALFEILFFNKPCIIIPLEMQHDSHQYANAYEMVIQNQRLFALIRQETIQKDTTALAQSIKKMITLKF